MTEREQIEFLIRRNETLRSTLGRCRTILFNMAQEHTTGWRSIFARWPISHEPLRSDARNLLPTVDVVMAGHVHPRVMCDGCDGYECETECAYPGVNRSA